ncbi:MAG: HPr(Ser) kinase/phosphatase [Blastocatellia bacterium]
MNTPIKPSISVYQVLKEATNYLDLRILAGDSGLNREINVCYLQRLGLALAQKSNCLDYGRIQVLGKSEHTFLMQLTSEERFKVFAKLALKNLSVILLTRDLDAPKELIILAEEAQLPVLVTSEISSIATAKLTEFLQEKLSPLVILHGVMVDMFGMGILLQGESGVGKSECALDLITRGHRLVSDDVVEVRRIGSDKLVCNAPAMVQDHMEIRGLGILNIKNLFGFSSISLSQRLSLIIKLERWEQQKFYDRIGLEEEFNEILELHIPLIRLPVTFGRNVSTLVEVAVRNHLLKLRGINAVQEFTNRHAAALGIKPSRQEK